MLNNWHPFEQRRMAGYVASIASNSLNEVAAKRLSRCQFLAQVLAKDTKKIGDLPEFSKLDFLTLE